MTLLVYAVAAGPFECRSAWNRFPLTIAVGWSCSECAYSGETWSLESDVLLENITLPVMILALISVLKFSWRTAFFPRSRLSGWCCTGGRAVLRNACRDVLEAPGGAWSGARSDARTPAGRRVRRNSLLVTRASRGVLEPPAMGRHVPEAASSG